MKPDKNKHSIQFLSDITRTNNFEIPKDYFKNVAESVLSEITLEKVHSKDNERFTLPKDYLESIDDTVIAKLKAEIIYQENDANSSIPVDYFDHIEDSVLGKLSKKQGLFQLKSLFKSKFTPLAIAASLLLIVTLGNVNKAQAVTFKDISSSDIELWVANGDLVFSVEDFTDPVSSTALDFDNFSRIYSDEQALDFLEETDLENILFND
ncbi:MAG: hypothetical protein COB98_00400 [Flavobacteriaceae bacterium]|nr:MAG: hypothetical protein COB98_00400 [Flavobacteriaceae bacterium]